MQGKGFCDPAGASPDKFLVQDLQHHEAVFYFNVPGADEFCGFSRGGRNPDGGGQGLDIGQSLVVDCKIYLEPEKQA